MNSPSVQAMQRLTKLHKYSGLGFSSDPFHLDPSILKLDRDREMEKTEGEESPRESEKRKKMNSEKESKLIIDR